MNYLVDTTVFVDHLRGNNEATQFLEEKRPTISTVTIAELIQGTKNKKELKIVLGLVKNFSEETINLKVAKKALELLTDFSTSNGLKFMDALIAATAIFNHLILVTNNIKHFRFIPELEVLSHAQAFKK